MVGAFGIGCSSDDGTQVIPPEPKQLIIESSLESIIVGDKVTFSVNVNGQSIKGVKLYIEDREIPNPHTFKEAGAFEVVAKKKGY